jgi:hypothetical protein
MGRINLTPGTHNILAVCAEDKIVGRTWTGCRLCLSWRVHVDAVESKCYNRCGCPKQTREVRRGCTWMCVPMPARACVSNPSSARSFEGWTRQAGSACRSACGEQAAGGSSGRARCGPRCSARSTKGWDFLLIPGKRYSRKKISPLNFFLKYSKFILKFRKTSLSIRKS